MPAALIFAASAIAWRSGKPADSTTMPIFMGGTELSNHGGTETQSRKRQSKRAVQRTRTFFSAYLHSLFFLLCVSVPLWLIQLWFQKLRERPDDTTERGRR